MSLRSFGTGLSLVGILAVTPADAGILALICSPAMRIVPDSVNPNYVQPQYPPQHNPSQHIPDPSLPEKINLRTPYFILQPGETPWKYMARSGLPESHMVDSSGFHDYQ